MTSRPRRWRIEPTDEWEQVELLCGWPEQRDYELICPLVLFGAPADGRSQETGASSGRTLRRKAARFQRGEPEEAHDAFSRAARIVERLAAEIEDDALKEGFPSAPQPRRVLEASGHKP